MPINLNDNLQVQAPKPADNRYGPYESTAEALAAVPAGSRYKGLILGVLSDDVVQNYWFKAGIEDEDLVVQVEFVPGVDGEDYGSETYDAIGVPIGIYYVDADYQILKYSPYETEPGGGNFAAEAAASAASAEAAAAAAAADASAAAGLAAAASADADAAAAAALSSGGGLAQPYVQINDEVDTAFRFVVTDASGIDRSLARITESGVIEAQGLSADSLTVNGNTVTGEVYGAEVFEVIGGIAPGIYYVDADYKVLKFASYEAELGGSGSGIPPDDIRAFTPDIDLTGTADMSVVLKTAHDAAAAAGYRHLFIEGPVRAPSTMYINSVIFLSRSGKGRLIGTYNKRVIPVGTSSAPYWSRVIPERHLKRLREKLQTATPTNPAIITYVSDSVGTKADALGYSSSLESILRQEIARQFGPDADKIRVVSRGIGGTRWGDLDRATATVTPGQSGVQWITTEAPWLDYVQSIEQSDLTPTARTPDVVMFFFGMNHTVPLTPEGVQKARGVIAEVESYSPKPDIIFITHLCPSLMVSDAPRAFRGSRSQQEGRRSLAGWARHYAAFRGFGLIDFARAQDCEMNGFDPWQVHWRNLLPVGTGTLTIPWTAPESVYDYGLTFFPPNPPSTFWASGQTIVFTLSPVTGNVLMLRRHVGTNKLEYKVMAATDVTSIDWTLTNSEPVTETSLDFEVSVKGETLLIAYNKLIVVDRPIDRSGGEFTPVISLLSGSASSFFYRDVFASSPLPVMPTLTDAEAWGTPGGTTGIGGSGDNHPSEVGIVALIDKTIQSTRFA
jgi:hypothetical protein